MKRSIEGTSADLDAPNEKNMRRIDISEQQAGTTNGTMSQGAQQYQTEGL